MATTIHIDKGLILQVKQRDETAFLELYDRTSTDVARLASYLLDDPSELEDVIQEIYVAIYRALSKFDTDKSFRAWMMGIVVRQVNAHRRRKWRFHRNDAVLAKNFGSVQVRDIADDVVDDLQSQLLVQSIRGLPAKFKAVVVLYYVHEYTRDEIGEILGIPPGTVASRLRLALERLRRTYPDKLSESEVNNNGL
jgi:RNA polymerase sigma-70 factor, ECF subfamily